MKWIGLTGGIASGKSSVVRILQELGHPVVDADHMARLAVQKGSEGLKAVIQCFGPEFLTDTQELDRKALAQAVFRDPAKLKQLEDIVHPIVRDLVAKERRRLESQHHKFAFYDVPLLFEKNMEDMFDMVVVVTVDPKVQKERLKTRDHLDDEKAEQRLRVQWPLVEKVKRADFVIDNSGSLLELKNKVLQLVQFIEANS